jgi:Cu2+-exporting ATPase
VLCHHCQAPIPRGAPSASFCCRGCEVVHDLLEREGLQRFYALARDARLAPVAAPAPDRSLAWLEPLLEPQAGEEVRTLDLDVQGIQCAACVWLIDQLFRRESGALSCTVNPALGRARLVFRRPFDVEQFIRRVEGFGYRTGPPLKTQAVDGLTWRLGFCAALTLNVMLFSVSFYFGLAPADGEVFHLFTALSFALSTLNVAVGGWPFFRAAARGLRAHVLHLDLPIALGIALVFVTSLVQARSGRGDLAYLDTLNAFITLMLVGRWLQRRIIEKNRAYLLDDAGLEGLVCRRVESHGPRVVPAAAIREQDALLVAPGELIAVDARLEDDQAWVSLDWLNGESAPQVEVKGARLRAGSFNAGASALHLTALSRLSATALPTLLQQAAATARPDAFYDRLARTWATRVLLIAASGFALWLPHSFTRALEVAIALLVVTCPCAIGLSIPLAYELVQARLRRAGFYARSEDVLDRLRAVKKVLFDKTGTLTLSRLELTHPPKLTEAQRDVAYNLAARSAHPVSACIARAIGGRFAPTFASTERPGVGVEHVDAQGRTWRLGRGGFTCDSELIARFELAEVLRPGAREQVQALRKQGYETWLISGDALERVHTTALKLDIAPEHALAAQTPEQKAAQVARIDHGDTLYLGDGVNDAPAFAAALCAGTVAIERPVMPSRSAFFFVGEGLQPLGQALKLARKLHRTVRRLLALSLAYNLAAVGAGLFGAITPLRAAIFMPLSSLSLLLFTLASLRERRHAPSAFKEAKAS